MSDTQSSGPMESLKEPQPVNVESKEQPKDNIQKEVQSLYQTVKVNTGSILQSFKDGKTQEALFLTILTGQIIKQVEQTKLVGKDKKEVAIELIKTIIKEECSEDKKQTALLLVDAIVDPLIDQLVDVAKNVNVMSSSLSSQSSSNSPPKPCCAIM